VVFVVLLPCVVLLISLAYDVVSGVDSGGGVGVIVIICDGVVAVVDVAVVGVGGGLLWL